MSVELRDLSIVIVTWHSADDLPPLLASLAPDLAAGAELVVVENASGDATPAVVHAAVPGARVIVNPANVGFAVAANHGLAAARGAFVLFLNPDTVVQPATIPRALAHLAADSDIGVLGCRTVNADGTPQPTVERFYSVGRLVADAVLQRRGPAGRPRGWVPARTEDVDWLYGSFLLCRRTALATIGGFDGAYEMYGEDLDLCHRMRAAGLRVVFFADATIMHRGNRSGARRYGATRDAETLKGTLRFFRRRRGAAAERAFRLLAGTSFVLKAAVNALLALGVDGNAASRARLYARMAWVCATGVAASTERLRPATSEIERLR